LFKLDEAISAAAGSRRLMVSSNFMMSGSQDQIRAALDELQDERKYFSIAVYRIEGDSAVRVASAGATCGKCDKVSLSSGNIGRVARSGVVHAVDDVSKDASYKSCFSEVRAETVVPVTASGKTIGVIDVESGSGPIDPADLLDFAALMWELLNGSSTPVSA
jgi:putative methionine-R-sulfoxide reductase with GAF domain